MTLPNADEITFDRFIGQNLEIMRRPEELRTTRYGCGSQIASIVSERDGQTERVDFSYEGLALSKMVYSGELDASVDYYYDDFRKLSLLSYADGYTTYSYSANQLILVDDIILEYSNALLPATKEYDTVMNMQRSYNGYGELESKQYTFKDIPLFEQNVLERNALGKILRKEELLDGEKCFYTYAYDAKGRLIDALHQGENGQLILHESYAYDANGNRNEASYETANSKQIRHVGYYQDGGRSDKIATYNGKPYVYDTNGNLRQKGSMQLRYGSLGELLSVTLENGDVITYKYNALNQRVAKYKNNQLVERYLWKDLTTLLAIYVGDANNYQILRFEYTDERVPFRMVYNQNTYHLIYDTIGSLRRIVDDAGTIIGEITYDSYGYVQSSKMPLESAFLGFAGGLYDPDTKLTRFGYRDYDAETGKWTAKDPIGFAGGDTNLYGYVLGDPVNFVDPTGLIHYNKPPPATVPVTGKTADALKCVESCLQKRTKNSNLDLLVTGGAEQSGHSKNSYHYKGKACDIAGPKFNPISNSDIVVCAQICGFKAGTFEDYNGDNRDHWHLQTEPGNGLKGFQ